MNNNITIMYQLKKYIKNNMINCLLHSRLPGKANDNVLITFDDGPHPIITPCVLKLLKKYSCKAVFFVVGKYVEKYPDILKMIVNEGHIIGNHSYYHYNEVKINPLVYFKDVLRCQNIIKNIIEYEPILFRPPLGRIDKSSIFTAYKLKSKIILWSCSGGEWNENIYKNSCEIGLEMNKKIKTKDIVLLHDNNQKTPIILECILKELQIRNINIYNSVEFIL